MIMQLSMSVGVTVAGLLLGAFGQDALASSDHTHSLFMTAWAWMALIIALPALVFWRVPKETSKNVDLRRRRKP